MSRQRLPLPSGILENIVLRQHRLALHAERPRRRLSTRQKLFWLLLRRAWDGWEQPLILDSPRTVVGWHRAGFRTHLGLGRDTPEGRVATSLPS